MSRAKFVGGKKGLTQPTRALTKDELAAAARASFDTAEDLLEDAVVLAAAGRGARASALACIALEELGKARLCYELHEGRAQRHRAPAAFWKVWNAHHRKAAYGLYGRDTLAPDAMERFLTIRLSEKSPQAALAELGQMHRNAIETAEAIVALREVCLYSDVFAGPVSAFPHRPVPGGSGDLVSIVHILAASLRPKVHALSVSPLLYPFSPSTVPPA